MFNKLPGPRGRRPLWLRLPWLCVVVFSSLLGITTLSWLPAEFTDVMSSNGVLVSLAIGLGVLLIWVVAAVWQTRSWQRRSQPHPQQVARPPVGWFLWVYLGCQLVMFINAGAVIGGAGQALELGLAGWIKLDSWV